MEKYFAGINDPIDRKLAVRDHADSELNNQSYPVEIDPNERQKLIIH